MFIIHTKPFTLFNEKFAVVAGLEDQAGIESTAIR